MAPVDWLILALCALSAGTGVWRGFVKEALSLLTLLAAFWLAWRYGALLAPALGNWAAAPEVRLWTARVIVFVIVIVVGAVVSWFARQLIRHSALSGVDRMLGGAFGLARGVLIVGLLVIVLDLFQLNQDDWWQSALLRPYAEQVAATMKKYAELGTRYVQGGLAV